MSETNYHRPLKLPADRSSRMAKALEADESSIAAGGVPFSGVVVNRRDVMGHRYLAVKGFPYSQSVANVPLKGDVL